MPWVCFSADFDWEQQRGVTIAYRAGWTGLVTTPCAEAAGICATAVARPEDAPKEKINGRRRTSRRIGLRDQS